MKQRAMKKGLSALCLVLALCMTFQSATLAADLSADTSTSISSASEEADNAEGDASSGEEDNAEDEDEADTSAEEEEADPAEEEEAEEAADPVEEEAEEAADPAEEEAEEAADPAEEAKEAADPVEEEEAAEEEAEADVTVSAQVTTSTDTGWTYVSNSSASYWTFSYKESSTATAAPAADTVLYIPNSTTDETNVKTTFKAGYYYFDEDGKLVADGTTASVGATKVLAASSDDGSYVCNTSATNSGKVVKVVTTQTTDTDGYVTVSSTASNYTGSYDGLYYYNGSKFTGYIRTSSSSYVWKVTSGVLGSKLTGQMSTSTAYVRMDTGAKSTGDGLWYYNGSKFTGYIRTSSGGAVWVIKSGKNNGKLTGQMSTSTAYVRTDTAKKSTGDGLWYYNGSKFTGYVRTSSGGAVWVIKSGKNNGKLTGQMSTSTAYVRTDTAKKSTGDGLWYYNGSKFTGYVRTSSGGAVWVIKSGKNNGRLTGQMSTSTAYVRTDTAKKSTGDGLWYYNGSKFTGYIRRSSSDYVWVVTSGKGGTKLTGTMSTSKYYLRTDTGTRSKGDGKYYKSGKVYTGVVGSYYYKKGVKQTSLRGWYSFDDSGNTSTKSSANTYYFTSSGKVYTNCWKNLKRNGTTYRFYFNSDGTLCKNLYKKSSAWKKKATKLVISRSTHTATLYATYNGSYKIPTKSFVISTSRLSSNFKVGTYKLSQRQSWFTISSTNWWYKWATYISGSGSWCHSEQYYTKGDSKSLRVSSYNDLGTNQSKMCIRMQVVNAKLIYDMRGYGSIKTVVLNKSSDAGPFGKMTITDNVDASGKLSGTKSYDPTDPMYT